MFNKIKVLLIFYLKNILISFSMIKLDLSTKNICGKKALFVDVEKSIINMNNSYVVPVDISIGRIPGE